MENPALHNPPHLTCAIGSDNIIYLEMGGALSSSHLKEFEIWADQVRKAMVHVATIDKNHVHTLIHGLPDVAIDKAGINALSELMKFNKNYATKTAVYGVNAIAKAILHSVIVITHRYTMKVFDTKEEALEWLKIDEHTTPPLQT